MTVQDVGSGVLFGETQRWKTSGMKSVTFTVKFLNAPFISLGLRGSMISEHRDRKVRLSLASEIRSRISPTAASRASVTLSISKTRRIVIACLAERQR